MRAVADDAGQAAVPSEQEHRAVRAPEPSPLALLEGTSAMLDMDRHEIGTPLGDLEAVSPL